MENVIGTIVESKNDALGHEVTHKVIHPECCVVADELGGKVYQNEDDHVGGERPSCTNRSVQKSDIKSKQARYLVIIH